MSAEQIKKLQQQQEAQALRLQQMDMRHRADQARRSYSPQPDEGFVEQQQTQPAAPVYNQVDEQEALIEALTNRITQQVTQNVTAFSNAQKGVDDRMKRLIDKYPGIQDDDSVITKAARDEYARISRENPGLLGVDKGAAYELAVETAAAKIGARPMNAEFNPMQDYTMSAGPQQNLAARRSASGKNFLTPKILANFEAFAKSHPDFSLDPSTPQGKKNLEELNEYSERFRANVDESHLKYR